MCTHTAVATYERHEATLSSHLWLILRLHNQEVEANFQLLGCFEGMS